MPSRVGHRRARNALTELMQGLGKTVGAADAASATGDATHVEPAKRQAAETAEAAGAQEAAKAAAETPAVVPARVQAAADAPVEAPAGPEEAMAGQPMDGAVTVAAVAQPTADPSDRSPSDLASSAAMCATAAWRQREDERTRTGGQAPPLQTPRAGPPGTSPPSTIRFTSLAEARQAAESKAAKAAAKAAAAQAEVAVATMRRHSLAQGAVCTASAVPATPCMPTAASGTQSARGGPATPAPAEPLKPVPASARSASNVKAGGKEGESTPARSALGVAVKRFDTAKTVHVTLYDDGSGPKENTPPKARWNMGTAARVARAAWGMKGRNGSGRGEGDTTAAQI